MDNLNSFIEDWHFILTVNYMTSQAGNIINHVIWNIFMKQFTYHKLSSVKNLWVKIYQIIMQWMENNYITVIDENQSMKSFK